LTFEEFLFFISIAFFLRCGYPVAVFFVYVFFSCQKKNRVFWDNWVRLFIFATSKLKKERLAI